MWLTLLGARKIRRIRLNFLRKLNYFISISLIPNKFKFTQLYPGGDKAVYAFKGMVCYWGSHYFLYIIKDEKWVQVNDTYIHSKHSNIPNFNTFIVEPSWTGIVENCTQGGILPVMLLFERWDTKKEIKKAKESLGLEVEYLGS